MKMTLTEINVYPVKSLRGISVPEKCVEARGLTGDRRWMLIDEKGVFLSQRQHPQMARIAVAMKSDHLEITAPEMEFLRVSFPPRSDRRIAVSIWNSVCRAQWVDEKADEWFARYLGIPCWMVYMPDETRRAVDLEFAVHEDIVSFADAFPCLLIGQASLDDLNRRLNSPVPMNRFRPNLVVSGAAPFAEDRWKKIRIGSAVFHVVKACARCAVPAVDQITGTVTGNEPLQTLAKYRTVNQKILFGQNLIPEGGGVVRVEDEVEVIEEKSDNDSPQSRRER